MSDYRSLRIAFMVILLSLLLSSCNY